MHVCAMIDARGRASSAAACGGNIAQRFKPRISVIHAEQSNGSTCTCSRPSLRLSRHPASQHRACVRVRVSARAHNSLTRARARLILAVRDGRSPFLTDQPRGCRTLRW